MVIILGTGFIVCNFVAALPILYFVEFPLIRLMQYIIFPYCSHDNFLHEH